MLREKAQEHDAQASLKLVLGYLAIKDSETLEERVGVLARLGYEIAKLHKFATRRR
jgi:hypothetical protein